MSYDLDLYLSRELALKPPGANTGAQFVAEPPARCEDEGLPAAYLPLLGKRRRWRVRLHIEGATEAPALQSFETWLSEVLAETGGIVIDEQTGRFETKA